MPQESLEGIVAGLDVLIRARYPLIAVNTPEEGRFHRIVRAVALPDGARGHVRRGPAIRWCPDLDPVIGFATARRSSRRDPS